jgi:predicted PurR-regulated permease PerM
MGRKIFLVALGLAFLYLISPMLLALIMGGVLTVLFLPGLRWLEKRGVPTRLGALLVTIAVTALILVPASFLIFTGAKSGMQQLQALQGLRAPPEVANAVPGEPGWIEALMNHPTTVRITEIASRWFPVSTEEIAGTFRDLAAGIGRRAAALLGKLLAQLPGMALDLVLVGVSLFFFLADARGLIAYARSHSFLDERETEKTFASIAVACRSVILASVAAATVQALIFLIALYIVGVPNATLLGLLVFVASFVPVIGSAPVTFGVALHQLLFASTSAGVALLIVAVVVATIDNVVRALFLKGAADLHPLVAFMAALGGLQALGFPGVFIGPIVAVVFFASLPAVKAARAR